MKKLEANKSNVFKYIGKIRKYISLEQVNNLYADLQAKGIESNKIMIRGLNDMRFSTLKGRIRTT
jgi:hypothetical protein